MKTYYLATSDDNLTCWNCGCEYTAHARDEECPRKGIDRKTADRIDGYDRNDLGESPDY